MLALARHGPHGRNVELLLDDLAAIPPAAAQRLEQRRRIGQAIGLCLDERDARLLLGLLRVEQNDEIDVAGAEVLLDMREADLGGAGEIAGSA